MTQQRRRRSRGSWSGLAALTLSLWLSPSARAAALYLEDSPAAQELIEDAEGLLRQDRVGEAVSQLQRVIETYGNKLMPTGDDRYTDASLWVQTRIQREPRLLEAYRTRLDATARRALETALLPRPDAAALQQVAAQYALTRPGLEALLRLAGLALEQADPDAAALAISRTDDHPDRAEFADQRAVLLAWTAALRGSDDPAAAGGLDGASASAAMIQPLLDTLAQLRARMQKLSTEVVTPPLQRPLWELDLATLRPDDADEAANRQGGESPWPIEPVLWKRSLLLTDGQQAWAVDRLSGRPQWSYAYVPPPSPDVPMQVQMRGVGRGVVEPRRLATDADAAYGVMGQLMPWLGRRQQFSTTTQVVALIAATGQQRWAVSAEDTDPSLSRVTFYGTPEIVAGQVIVLARRTQATSFQDSYLISLDARTGQLRWRRHLGSSNAGNNFRGGGAEMIRILRDGYRLFLLDPAGSALCVDATDGSIRWLSVLVDEPAEPQRGRFRTNFSLFSEQAGPVLCEAGLIIPARTDSAQGLLLDPQTGQMLRSLDKTGVARSRDILSLPDGDLLVIGNRLQRLDGKTLALQWTLPNPDGADSNQLLVAALLPPSLRESDSSPAADPAARAVLAYGGTAFYEVDLVEGVVRATHAVPWTGSVLAFDGGWIVSNAAQLGGYLEWDSAYAALTAAAQMQPIDPAPGLDLAMLAFNAQRPAAVAEGVDAALAALALSTSDDADPAAVEARRTAVLGTLLDLTRQQSAANAQSSAIIFERLAGASQTPGQLIAFHLRRGDYLEGIGRYDEAAAAYQAVLLDPDLAEHRFTLDDITRRGSIAARQRLFELIEAHGRGLYTAFSARAANELQTLITRDDQQAIAQLLALGERYPLAPAAAEALLRAAERQAKSSEPAAAITQFRRAFALAGDERLRREAAGGLADYYLAQQRPDAAARWLRLVFRDHPTLQPTRLGQAAAATDWWAMLDPLLAADGPSAMRDGSLPAVRWPLNQTITLDGTPLPLLDATASGASGGASGGTSGGRGTRDLLLRTGRRDGMLSLYRLPSAEPQWTIPAQTGDWSVVDQRPDSAVLYAARSKTLLSLDLADGSPLWPSIEVEALLSEAGLPSWSERQREVAGPAVLELIEADNRAIVLRGKTPAATALPPQVLAGEAVVVVVDSAGRAAGIDRYTGRVLWHYAAPLNRVEQVKVIDDLLAIAGSVAPDTEAQASVLVLLDLATGRPRFAPFEAQAPYRWVGADDRGDLLTLAGGEVTLHQRTDGRVRWRTPLGPLNDNATVALSGRTIFFADGNRLVSVNLDYGNILAERNDLPNRLRLLGLPEGVLCLLPDSAVLLNPQGQTLWRDAVALEPKRFLHALPSRDLLWLVPQPTGASDTTLRLYALDPVTGVIVYAATVPRLPLALQTVDLWLQPDALILTARGQTFVLTHPD